MRSILSGDFVKGENNHFPVTSTIPFSSSISPFSSYTCASIAATLHSF